MFIKKFQVLNFKSFKDVTFHFNDDLNIFTGANNAGKTMALEALSLWVECFLRLLRKAERSDPKLSLGRGGYRLGYQKQNYFGSIISAHLSQNRDLFYQTDSRLEVLVQACLEHDGATFELGFVIVDRRNQYEINLAQKDFDYGAFNTFFTTFPRPVRAAFARPVSFLEVAEEFQTPPKINAMQDAHRAFEVTRNRLYQLAKNAVIFNEFRTNLSYILGYQAFDTKFEGRETDDVVLKALFLLDPSDTYKEISLLGSGALQIIALLLCCYEQATDLNLILLDEPDSHIHRNIQSRLLEVLTKFTNNTQIFLTTHNEGLIRSADPCHLFHLEPKPVAIYHPIIEESIAGAAKGFQSMPVSRVLGSLGHQNGLEFINAIEADRLFLVEGQDDAAHFHQLLPKTSIRYKDKYMFWSHKGVADIIKNIKVYKDIFSKIRNQKTLWEKSKLIFDKDFMTESQRIDLMKGLSDFLGIPVHIWSAYTFESTLLKDSAKLARLLARYLDRTDISAVEDVLRAEIVNQCEQLKSSLEDDKTIHKIFNEVKNRRDDVKGLQKNLGSLFPADALIQQTFKTYALQELNAGQIHHIANKDVFNTVVSKAFEGTGKLYDESMLPAILSLVEPGTWIDEWTEALNPNN